MRKSLRNVLILAVLVAIGVLLRRTLLAPGPLEVTVVAVERGRVEDTVTNSKAGTIEARRRARLSPGTSGIVRELGVVRGQHVPAGEILLEIDDSTQRAELEHSRKALEVAQGRNESACITADRARREFERNRKLAETNIVSVDVVDALESAYELASARCRVAAAEVALAEAAVEVARAEHEKTVLRAPFDAIIAEVSVELGEWVTPSVPLLAAPDVIDAIDPSSLYVSAPMDEVDSARLAAELPVRVTIDPFPDRSFLGKVVRVAPFVLDVEQQNRTLEIEVELEDREFSRTLLPGTSADVEVVLSAREDVLRIPSYSLLEGGRVFLVEDGVVVAREVEVGLRNWDWTEIRSGLAEGDRIVTSLDRAEVVPGARVGIAGTGR